MAKFRKLSNGIQLASRASAGLRTARDSHVAGVLRIASIHHGGPVGAPPLTFDAASARWRSFQDFHMNTRGWDDIGYNLGVDGRGRLYQGRPVGVLPAAVGGHNSNSVGIVFLQDGRKHRLNWLQRRTLATLFKHGVPEIELPPLRELKVRGHNEFSGHESNECPGQHIERHLRWRRAQPNR